VLCLTQPDTNLGAVSVSASATEPER
jgi:hypothetical protein